MSKLIIKVLGVLIIVLSLLQSTVSLPNQAQGTPPVPVLPNIASNSSPFFKFNR